MHEPAENILVCRDLDKSYRQGREVIQVLDRLNLTVLKGEMVAIVGHSGSGKSTLLNLMGGLDQADAGDVIVAGENLKKLNEDQKALFRNRHLGFVYQFHHLLPEFSALENVMMPLLIRKIQKNRASKMALDMLQRVGLESRHLHRPEALSGGERQRVAIARALVNRPDCILMDEPTGNLDEATAHSVVELMLSLKKDSKTSFVVVTHDMPLARLMDSVYELRHGSLHPL
ncbi:MAG: lipoprotein-releasing ABC transporter ATP-binding protein LolD [Pseudomonadales bacterium]|nr:lipoprotein-releasing ABC transporter ATP-binding protein LolD [Pseudomonadales bacterium]